MTKQNRKKVLFLVNSLQIGGAENAFVKQANYFSKQGIKVYFGVLSTSNKKNFQDQLQVKIRDFGFQGIFDVQAYQKLKAYIKKHDIDIVYSTLDNANIVARVAKLFCPGLFVVIRESGMANRKSWKIKLSDLILNFLANKVIAVSSHVKDSLKAYQFLHSGRIVVLANGIEVFSGQKELALKFDQHKESFDMLNVGSMKNNNKGQGNLIKILRQLRQEQPKLNIRLILVGDGKLRQDFQDLVEKYKLNKYVIFTGMLDKEKLNHFYSAADIFILNSNNEGCPNVVLEAMSFGLPVISTKVGGTTEMIDEGESGYLVNSGDHDTIKTRILDLYNDKALRQSMGQQSIDRVSKRFLFDGQMKKLINILGLK
ncbi:glycosyltransferase [Candidatus Parcubacteria bacterium]|jgi:glycosyltransferase involved in cell wall biosynthesis|nr:glycosyltransferase [Candidatus Parcubacteria bacterium]